MAGNRTRVNCLEGSYAHHYTTIAWHCIVPSLYELLETTHGDHRELNLGHCLNVFILITYAIVT